MTRRRKKLSKIVVYLAAVGVSQQHLSNGRSGNSSIVLTIQATIKTTEKAVIEEDCDNWLQSILYQNCDANNFELLKFSPMVVVIVYLCVNYRDLNI